MRLEGLNELGSFDFSSLVSSIGSTITSQAPALLKAQLDKKMAELQVKQAAAQAKAMSFAQPMNQPATTQAVVAENKNQGIDKKFLIGGGVAVGALILLLALKR